MTGSEGFPSYGEPDNVPEFGLTGDPRFKQNLRQLTAGPYAGIELFGEEDTCVYQGTC